MEIKGLSKLFYNTYNNCNEILKKDTRPYAVLLCDIDGIIYAIPVRGHVNHKYCLRTPNPHPDKQSSALDFSKAVPIINPSYIGNDMTISNAEFNFLKSSIGKIYAGMKKYLNDYKKNYSKIHIPANRAFCDKSALQYFHKELGI